jgi:ABC-type nitrate/sulfonate/bicarbonate transport system substrate-binding protein
LKALFVTGGDASGGMPSNDLIAILASRASGIRPGHLEDLRGKRVGLSALTEAHPYYWYVLTAKGLDPRSAASVVDVPTPRLADALANGTVDAIVTWEPMLSQGAAGALGVRGIPRGAS